MKIIDWNIKVDALRTWIRPLWIWGPRKQLFKEVLLREKPEIFCVQEALKHQIDFFDEFLIEYKHIGRPREELPREGGEYCAVFYNASVLDLKKHGTFWLSQTPDVPSRGWDTYPRICTWGIFQEKRKEKEFLILNTHLPLAHNLFGKEKALGVIKEHLLSFKKMPTILTGDFNSRPTSNIWKQIYAMGFQKNPQTHITHRILSIPAFCYDAIFTTSDWSVQTYRLLKEHRGIIYPSDHFGICATVDLQ